MSHTKEVTQELNRIYEDRGRLVPSEVLEEATPEDSVLHPMFEWDDAKAGHEHRLWQSRQLIRKVKLIIEEREERVFHVPKLISEDRREGGYLPGSVLIMRQDRFESALRELFQKMRAAKRSYEELVFIAASEQKEPWVMQSLNRVETSLDDGVEVIGGLLH